MIVTISVLFWSFSINMFQQPKSQVSKLKKFRLFLKSIKSKVNKNKRDQSSKEFRRQTQFLPTVFTSPCPYTYSYAAYANIRYNTTPHKNFWYSASPYAVSGSVVSPLPKVPMLKQHLPLQSQHSLFTESEYEEMTSDFCTLPRKKMKYRIKQRVFEKSLNAILLEAKREIIEESSGDEKDDTYVHENKDNIYEELNLSQSFVDQIYEEII